MIGERELGRLSYLDYPNALSREIRDHETPREIGERQIYRYLEKDYRLNSAEIAVVRDVGRFRIVESRTLANSSTKASRTQPGWICVTFRTRNLSASSICRATTA
jgi:hypothetical protein